MFTGLRFLFSKEILLRMCSDRSRMANDRTEEEMTDTNDSSQPPVKRWKSDTEHETDEIAKQLSDLHDDYLELIFDWLDLNDLMTMMKVDERFHQPIERTFNRKFGVKLLITMYLRDAREKHSNELTLRAVDKIIAFLQCFGSLIANLTVIFDKSKSDDCMSIEQSVVEHCVKLKELHLKLGRKAAFDFIAKPFAQLEVLRIVHGHLGEAMSRFGDWFPKLQTLEIDHVTVADRIYIQGTLPFLEHLEIDVKLLKPKKRFSQKNIDAAINLNPRLRSIRLKIGKCSPSTLDGNWLRRSSLCELKSFNNKNI